MYLAVLKERDTVLMVIPTITNEKVQRIFETMKSFHLYSTLGLF